MYGLAGRLGTKGAASSLGSLAASPRGECSAGRVDPERAVLGTYEASPSRWSSKECRSSVEDVIEAMSFSLSLALTELCEDEVPLAR